MHRVQKRVETWEFTLESDKSQQFKTHFLVVELFLFEIVNYIGFNTSAICEVLVFGVCSDTGDSCELTFPIELFILKFKLGNINSIGVLKKLLLYLFSHF
jgi:hypothetical protein